MTYVIASPYIDVKDGACRDVCPVECIYEGGRMMYIQPDECIDCGLCLSVCPVDAIHSDAELPLQRNISARVNAEYFGPGVTGLGARRGANASNASALDHPVVAAHPRA